LRSLLIVATPYKYKYTHANIRVRARETRRESERPHARDKERERGRGGEERLRNARDKGGVCVRETDRTPAALER